MTKSHQQPESSSKRPEDLFAALYPNITAWVKGGWIEIGRNDFNQSCVRALDEGGLVWEGESDYSSLHDALQALDAGIGAWRAEQGL